MLCKDVREQRRDPLLHGVWVAVDDCADAEDGRMQLAELYGILRRLLRREVDLSHKADEAVLWIAMSSGRKLKIR